MVDKAVLIPNAEHPISIVPAASRIRVRVAGLTVAETTRALVLAEANYSPVYYVPVEDVDQSLLAPSAHTTYCPYKGDCIYYDIPAGGEGAKNAVWTYRAPFAAVAAIAGHVAFYPQRVDDIEVDGSQ